MDRGLKRRAGWSKRLKERENGGQGLNTCRRAGYTSQKKKTPRNKDQLHKDL